MVIDGITDSLVLRVEQSPLGCSLAYRDDEQDDIFRLNKVSNKSVVLKNCFRDNPLQCIDEFFLIMRLVGADIDNFCI